MNRGEDFSLLYTSPIDKAEKKHFAKNSIHQKFNTL